MQLGEFDAHLNAQRSVEIRQGLVQEEHRRMPDDGAAHGDALAARKLTWFALKKRFELQNSCGGEHLGWRSSRATPASRRAKPMLSATLICG